MDAITQSSEQSAHGQHSWLDGYELPELAPILGSCASTYKFFTEVLNAPRQSLRPWLCTGSNICK